MDQSPWRNRKRQLTTHFASFAHPEVGPHNGFMKGFRVHLLSAGKEYTLELCGLTENTVNVDGLCISKELQGRCLNAPIIKK